MVLGDAKVWKVEHSILFGGLLSGKDEKIMQNGLVFAQMEGHKNQKINENGAPESQKCCRGSKFKVAALGNAGCSFCIEGRVLGSEMGPEGRRKINCAGVISKRVLKRFSRFGRIGPGVR